MSVTTWIGIAYSIRIQIMRYRDLEYNLASRTLGTPTFKIVVKKHYATIGICYRYDDISNASSLYLIRSFPSFFGLGLPITVQAWVV